MGVGPTQGVRRIVHTMNRDMVWRDRGACRGLEPEIFYPDPEDDTEADIAKQVCGRCSVKVTCLEFALQFREKEGVWGGATERERRRIVRQRRRTA
jgi:WhiB family transcriptional regulator, redox-sensing transcriptional regulator